MSNVRAWLSSIGLSQYADAFERNDVDAEVLLELDHELLQQIGVSSVGHRVKILKARNAIGEVPAELGSEHDVSDPYSTSRTAERRQLTVMFVDLVGSTALSGRLDPEEMSDLLRTYQDTVAGEIGHFDGYVARFMGDGVLAYFGWPRAHEDDAERAVRAGLAVLKAMPELGSPEAPLEARIGIATGLVVVGESIGGGAAQEEAVVGETPNLAARLQGLAEPGQIVIGGSTRRLLGGNFALNDLGRVSVKGINEPVETYAVVKEVLSASRFEAHSSGALTTMVGREPELALLLERWGRAKGGEGQGIVLSGEAGIGKSRIISALFDSLSEDPHVTSLLQCSPFHMGSTLWPLIQKLNQAANLGGDEPTEARLDKLEGQLNEAGTDVQNAGPVISKLVGIDGTQRYGESHLPPQFERAKTLEALADWLFGVAGARPHLVVLEDVHWVDPTTLEFLELFFDRFEAASALLLLTTRPGQRELLPARSNVTRVTLNRLSRRGIETIVGRIGGEDLSPTLVDTIVSRTAGVPLFVEELTKAIVEGSSYVIPETLHDSLVARLDRIPGAKGVAQVAACIGREFSHALLSAISNRAAPDLRSALDQLAESELIFPHGVTPEVVYSFKHALLRDAAYESLLKSRRREIHALILEELQRQHSVAPEVLAHHAEGAELSELAIKYWVQAAEFGAERFAYRESADHFQRALQVIERLPERSDLLELSVDLKLNLRNCLVPIGEADLSLQLAREAATDAAKLDDVARQARAASYVSILLWHTGRPSEGLSFGRDAVEWASQLADPGLKVASDFFLGQVYHVLGKFTDAKKCYEDVIYTLKGKRALERYGLPFLLASHSRAWLTLILGESGEFEIGKQLGNEAVRLSEDADLPFSLQQAYWALGNLFLLQEDLDKASSLMEKTLNVTETWGLHVWSGAINTSIGELNVQAGHVDEAIDILEGAAENMQSGRTSAIWLAPARISLARAYLARGQLGDAAACVEVALTLCRERQQQSCEASALHVRGEILIQQGLADPEQAERCFRSAHSMADRLGMRPLQAKCISGLAEVATARGDVLQARSELERAGEAFQRLAMPASEESVKRRRLALG